MIGARVGNWYLESELGRGVQGVVYAARGFDDSSRRAAVKVLTEARTREPAFLQRFPGEMLALHRLNHPNIVRLYDSGTHGGLAWYASERIDGTDLATRLESGRLPWPLVFSIAVQAARALKHGHMRNILHRDLKPAHFLLTPDGTLKLADFGVAKFVPQPPASPTPTLGSAAYLPPECASGKPLTRRSEFYSLGGVLYTLVTGRPPFAASTVVELIHKQCYTLPERPGMRVSDLPAEWDEFLCGLLDKNPSRRPASAAALLGELDRIRGRLERRGEPIVVPADTGTSQMEPLRDEDAAADSESGEDNDRSRGQKVRFAVLLGLFLVVSGGIGYAFFRPSPSADALFSSAKPLLDSENPADWDRAWDEYLEPLSRKYPDRFTEEVTAARNRIQDHREQRRALVAGVKVEPQTDTEKWYLRGLRLAQAGDPDAARSTWTSLIAAFGSVESEKRWTDLARNGLKELEQSHTRHVSDRRAFQAALEQAKQLAASGKTAEAEGAFLALEELYRDDADAMTLIRTAQK